MLRLTYSNCFEELVDALCADVKEYRARSAANVFSPGEIIVPNHNVSAYLKFAIAQRLGIAANLHFQFLSSFIASRIPRQAGPSGSESSDDETQLRVLDKSHLHALLCSVLCDREFLAGEELAPVRGYLHASGTDPDSVDLRRYQLAETLATLFSDYSLSRPEMVAEWPTRLTLEDSRGAAMEAWQRELWLAIFGRRGVLRQLARDSGIEWVSGPALFQRKLAKDLGLPGHIYIIGFSYVQWAYHGVFARMARAATVHIYALNPCMEFWEDLRSGWEERLAGRQLGKRAEAQIQLSFNDGEDTPPLRLWGRPGRENIRLLNELTECDFDARFVDPVDLKTARTASLSRPNSASHCSPYRLSEPGRGDMTMLVALQRDILFRHPERTDSHNEVAEQISPHDDSVRILGCPSVKRELEVIGNEMWRLVHRDPTLRFNDIAVLLSRADQEMYQAHIPAVFGELQDIPHHLVDVPLQSESRVVEAFDLLLDLPFGRFTRPELLRILTHPSVLARYPDVDPSDWVHWSERLGIVHGADHGDHLSTYISKDVFNWQQGIRRLALGAFMAGERSGETRSINFGEAAYLPEELPSDLLPSAARFALIARSLISDARYCQRTEMPLSEWRIFFEVLLSSYLAPTGEDDERNLARCRDAIETLATRDLDHRPVSYRIAREFLRSEFDGLSGASGEYLAHGVTVAPLLPMRPIPYRVIFMAGLGEGRFPASERENPLDLRVLKRRRGDVTPRERDRYLFLETLLSAREGLYLSYVARDEQTGEALQPSSVVLELSHILKRGYASGEAAEHIAVNHPLRRYDPRYFPALFIHGEAADKSHKPGGSVASDGGLHLPAEREAPMVSVAPAAHRQANALALRRHLEHKLRERGRDMPSFADLRRVLEAPRFARLRERLGLLTIDVASGDSATRQEVAISLAMVRRFLECPLQAWAAAVLRLRDSEMQDLISRQDEAFATAVGPMVGLLREVFAAHLIAGERDIDALLHRYRKRAQHLELGGSAPTGLFSELEQECHIDILGRWHRHLHELTDGQPGSFRAYSFGRGRENADPGVLLPPIDLTIALPDAAGQERPIKVELFGQTEAMDVETVGSLVLVHGTKVYEKHGLRGFIDHLALAAAGITTDRSHPATVISAGEQKARYQLAPWSQSDALEYLGLLIADLLGSSHEYLLPCEAVFEQLYNPDKSIFAIVEQLKARGMGFSSLYGPITQLDDLYAPVDADLLIERRFGPLFDRMDAIEG
ncbi:MAG: exodeoxyribonuclease V subunit gamma [Proteobacteria bacterium]|nr:exodeoxyribonuclease V subunit gamma [Pseudomonadota bacterium]